MTQMQLNRRFEFYPNGDASAVCCKCRRVFFVNGATVGHHTLPDSVVAKKFAAKGWHLGSNKKKDTCPDCLKVRRKPQPTVKEEPELGKDPPVIPVIPRIDGASELPPREMTREDRRIIFAKLEEVYVDEQTGYSREWHDARVAADLNCPRKWVETIREENFGPQRTEQSAEIAELTKKLDGVTASLSLLTDQNSIHNAALRAMSDDLNTQRAAVDKTWAEVIRTRTELKKIIGH
jgi:hypothetical protein